MTTVLTPMITRTFNYVATEAEIFGGPSGREALQRDLEHFLSQDMPEEQVVMGLLTAIETILHGYKVQRLSEALMTILLRPPRG